MYNQGGMILHKKNKSKIKFSHEVLFYFHFIYNKIKLFIEKQIIIEK